ncbi:MAG: hypothetical protein WA639_17930 [Candidatus Acidiferrum sp.]
MENENARLISQYNWQMTAGATTPPIIRSDSLPELRRVLEKLPALREYLGDVLEVVLVLDACCVQSELRWRVGARKNPTARTYLHEAMVSGVVVAFAPFFLEGEIQKYIPKIAEDEGVLVGQVQKEWKEFKVLIHFYEPAQSTLPGNSVDLKDLDYVRVLEQVNGDFVYTSDSDFLKMGTRVMPPGLDRVLRDYARATTVILTVKLGSGFAVVAGGHVVYALATVIADFAGKLPPIVKVLLAACAGIALLHPDSRKRIIEFTRKLSRNVRVGFESTLSSPTVRSFIDYASLATTSRKAVLNVLPLRKGSPAIAFAHRVCQRAQVPLSDAQVAEQVKASGYVSRSRNFAAYIRHILRKDSRFSLTPQGLWTLRPGLYQL